MSTNTKLAAFDAAIAAELPRVSHVEYDSHEICKHFAGKVRERLLAAHDAEQAQQSERDAILARLEAVPVPEPFAWPTTGHGGRFVSAERLNDYRAAMLAAAKGGTQ